MPLLPTEANLRRALAVHLRPGESAEVLLGAGRRVMALTQARLLISTFPLLRAPELLVALPREAITGLSWSEDAAELALMLQVDTLDAAHQVSLPRAFSDLEAALDDLRERLELHAPEALDEEQ